VFEWETPIVCPDEVKMEGCALTDEQLLYSFNLSSLSKSTVKVRLSSYSLAFSHCAHPGSE
jgi:insulin-like growth factor 2 receptor